ncbi:hypothetical protein CDZ97_07325 [Mameliella alba]|nr:hypothetical protein A9320_24975 [Ruegeria sp. PBVC088]OWV45578.1 hypothetical protein CDZ95_01025 [Mameliella alba]OWV62802.1 hypothetical protein CDZ98_01055 [Mameliella alba]OWV65677.1 hypothetical protein CDZ97_07325 [Mameliella alba]
MSNTFGRTGDPVLVMMETKMTDTLTRRRLLATAAAALPLAAMPRLAAAQAPDFLTIGGGPSGGVFGIVGTGVADILSRVFPSSIIDVQPGGSGPNLLRVRDGKADLGITSANNALDAWEGRDPATPDRPVQNARGLMNIMQSAIQIWVDADSDIRSLDDLRGKQVSAGQPGQTSWLAFENLLAAAGMTTDDIEADGGKLHPLSWSESHEALRNGQLDAVMWLSLWPHPTVMQNETVRKMRALSFDSAVLDKFMADSGAGFERVTLPAGLFEGQDVPAETVGTNTILFASADMPDDTAYAIVKQLWENLDDFKAVHSLLGNISKETVGRGMIIPLHPGAKAYFEEMGIPYSESSLGA